MVDLTGELGLGLGLVPAAWLDPRGSAPAIIAACLALLCVAALVRGALVRGAGSRGHG